MVAEKQREFILKGKVGKTADPEEVI